MDAWQDINPPMASAPRPEPRSTFSGRASPEEFATELTKCLALVVPAGMDQAARREWLAAAWEVCGHLSSDLLRHGCAHAKEVADHPSKIVPAIIAEANAWGDIGKKYSTRDSPLQLGMMPKRDVMDRRGEAMSAADTAELNERLERLGATARYREDGSRYFIEKDVIDAGIASPPHQ